MRLYVEYYIRKTTSGLGNCVALTEYYFMTQEHNRLIQKRPRALTARLRTKVQRCITDPALARDTQLRIKGLMRDRYFRASQCASFQNRTWSMRQKACAVTSVNL